MNCLKVFRNYNPCLHYHQRVVKMHNKSTIRSLLSQSYSCELQWHSRLKSDLLIKISSDSFFNELNQRYQKKLKVSAVDIDLFANCVTRVEQLEELQHLVYRLRRTKETVNTLDSTHHSFCRIFLKLKQTDRLLHILHNRIGFGVFVDHFVFNMICDQLIEQKDFRNAAKLSSLMMAEEDCGNRITQILALYSLHRYLRDENKSEWFDTEEVERLDKESQLYKNVCTDRAVITTDDNDEEVQYIRVPFLRNEYFDDHFDLRDPNHLCGKSLYFFGKQFEDIIGRSYQIIGLLLYQKWDKCLLLLNQFSKIKDNVVVKEVVERVEELVNNTTDDCSHKNQLLEIQKVLNELNSESKIVDKDLDELMSQLLSQLKDLESKDIELMPKLFKDWEKCREIALNKQIENLMKDQKKSKIIETKRELEEKERILYFFENFSKHEMDFVEAEQKIAELKAKTVVDEDYIPPELK